MASQHEPAKIEIYVNGQPIGQPFVAEELAITESRSELRIHARRCEVSARLLLAESASAGPTGTLLDGYFGVQP